jgi:hypothetical protein
MARYRTVSIDESAYLALKGHKYTQKRYGDGHGEWFFADSVDVQRHRKQFWGGVAVVNIHKWLAIRTIMKREQQKSPLWRKAVPTKKIDGLAIGEMYYWINDTSNIQPQTWSDSPLHKERFKQGRAFLSQKEASEARFELLKVQ